MSNTQFKPKKKPYRLLRSHTLYQGKIIRLEKDTLILNADPDHTVIRETVIHPGAVVILPFVDKSHLLLLKQFRYAAKANLWEIPAGTRERGESTLSCAKRELEEETGFKAKRWRFLSRFFPAPGISTEVMTLYLAQDLIPGSKNLDPDEWIVHEAVSLDKAIRMIQKGIIQDAKSIVGILWAKLLLR